MKPPGTNAGLPRMTLRGSGSISRFANDSAISASLRCNVIDSSSLEVLTSSFPKGEQKANRVQSD